jgi:NNP family nitrate/nitrite transporter-like MFS transporter
LIPDVFLGVGQREAAGADRATEETNLRKANTEAAAALGFASAIGAFGGFFIPMSYGASISSTGDAATALYVFIVFYLSCIFLTRPYLSRKYAALPA